MIALPPPLTNLHKAVSPTRPPKETVATVYAISLLLKTAAQSLSLLEDKNQPTAPPSQSSQPDLFREPKHEETELAVTRRLLHVDSALHDIVPPPVPAARPSTRNSGPVGDQVAREVQQLHTELEDAAASPWNVLKVQLTKQGRLTTLNAAIQELVDALDNLVPRLETCLEKHIFDQPLGGERMILVLLEEGLAVAHEWTRELMLASKKEKSQFVFGPIAAMRFYEVAALAHQLEAAARVLSVFPELVPGFFVDDKGRYQPSVMMEKIESELPEYGERLKELSPVHLGYQFNMSLTALARTMDLTLSLQRTVQRELPVATAPGATWANTGNAIAKLLKEGLTNAIDIKRQTQKKQEYMHAAQIEEMIEMWNVMERREAQYIQRKILPKLAINHRFTVPPSASHPTPVNVRLLCSDHLTLGDLDLPVPMIGDGLLSGGSGSDGSEGEFDPALYADPKPKPVESKTGFGDVPNTRITPVLIHIHGGGFLAHSSATHANYLTEWAISLGVPIFSIDYRTMGHPIPLQDTTHAYNWILENAALFGCKWTRVIATGDSAGANILCAMVCIGLEGKSPLVQPDGLVFTYPVFDLSTAATTSRLLYLNDTILTHTFTRKLLADYSGDFDWSESSLSPLFVSDDILARFPPTCMASAAIDPLLDDAVRFARRLVKHEKLLSFNVYDGVTHGYLHLYQAIKKMKKPIDETAKWIKILLHGM